MGPKKGQLETNGALRWMVRSFAVLLLAGLAAASVQADETATDDKATTTASAPTPDVTSAVATDEDTTPAPTLEALRVYRDPETGALVKAPETRAKPLSAALRQRVSRSTVGLQAKTLRDGTETLDLQGRFLVLSVAKRQADGTLATTCVHDAEAAEAAMHGDAQPATAQPAEEASDVR